MEIHEWRLKDTVPQVVCALIYVINNLLQLVGSENCTGALGCVDLILGRSDCLCFQNSG